LNFYLKKYSFLPAQISDEPDSNLGMIVVIPCFNEPDLVSSLKSLSLCHLPQKKVEVIVVINSGDNHSEEIKTQNKKSLSEMKEWLKEVDQKSISFKSILVDNLPTKHAGVGLARKIGMDEAVAHFDKIGYDGIIVCFDADSLCDSNYLTEIETHFQKNQKTPGCSIYYEHPMEGDEHSAEIYQAITQYELHLRYYNQALRFCNLPYAFHTVGSSMAVRSSAYQKQGGMNKRKAGEDFYFLHKIISLGNFTELNSTRVIPSPRISDRVPFGTGKAIGDYVGNQDQQYHTYNFKSFELIKEWVEKIPDLFKSDFEKLQWTEKNKIASTHLLSFLESEKFGDALTEIRKNSPTLESFIKRFYVWFDAFRVLKLVHCLRDVVFENQSVEESARFFLINQTIAKQFCDVNELLNYFRFMDRNAGISG
jgi:glycosyltransferase involved in cell wall biosynthesis